MTSDWWARDDTIKQTFALMSMYNVMKMGLLILLLVFRTSRILIETELRLLVETQFVSKFVSHLFLNLRNTSICWHGYPSLVLVSYNKNIYLYIPVWEASILIYCHVKHHFDILVSERVLQKSIWNFHVAKC